MKNHPIIGINKETGKEETVWFNRSVVVLNCVFAQDSSKKWYILATKRGTASIEPYKWNCQCGYIDFDEDDQEAAIREAWEETGVTIDKKFMFFWKYITDPKKDSMQNISFRWCTLMPGTIDNYPVSIEHCEKNECLEAKWIPISDINTYEWAFDHDKIVTELYSMVNKEYSIIQQELN